MSDVVERRVGDLTIRMDRSVCVGFGHCMDTAPQAFIVGDDGVVAFVSPEDAARDVLLRACEVCPVEALTAIDATGFQVAP